MNMWRFLSILGVVGFLTGFGLAFLGNIEITFIVAPVSFFFMALGGCCPIILKPIAEFEESVSAVGIKLSMVGFLILVTGGCSISLFNLGEELFKVVNWIGAPAFILGILLNIYKARKNGEM